MHPHLAKHKLRDCLEAIYDLEECHIEHPYGKYFGICNSFKNALNGCLGEEVCILNAANARAKRERVENVWKEIDEEE
ncbi:cmc1-like protein [Basidiobolus meristosporus CBS 931.73]|uniref:COX assembly mitochondrial protein n=1 Tax=Basidiobolus meristosporus CBS 931.73 TaxID=1314790 RepID=A0A1Y1VX63_9FUNG|nr:cmc1-like protein [Basidiobolus meristosporus CBS 931.73]ORX75439.1 cmc1-like protein [Basidiobolus meristosporus CBS 931.73]|eukprot:ORX65576.1 cmc1-like protein [Basidiobolus meristosporus CBS 931.73]